MPHIEVGTGPAFPGRMTSQIRPPPPIPVSPCELAKNEMLSMECGKV